MRTSGRARSRSTSSSGGPEKPLVDHPLARPAGKSAWNVAKPEEILAAPSHQMPATRPQPDEAREADSEFQQLSDRRENPMPSRISWIPLHQSVGRRFRVRTGSERDSTLRRPRREKTPA